MFEAISMSHELGVFCDFVVEVYKLLPAPVTAAFFFLFAFTVFFYLLKMVH